MSQSILSKREAFLAAIKALVAAALLGAEVKRNLAKPEGIQPGGSVVIRYGDPGEQYRSLARERAAQKSVSM